MPFPQQEPRVFSKPAVERLNPNQMGVYGIYKQGQWVYVGSGDMRERLLAHLNGDNPCITAQRPTHWVGEVTANHRQREGELILELSPSCNQRVG